LSDAYQRFNNLRQRVIDPAVAELKTKSNLDVSYELKREGRKVVAIKFTFRDVAQLPLNLELDPEDLPPLPEFDPAEDSEWLANQPLGELAEAQEAGLLFTVSAEEEEQSE